MNKSGFIVIFCLLFTCRDTINSEVTNRVKVNNTMQRDPIIETNEKMDFSKPPVSIKEYTLNDNLFWVTSSIIDTKYLDNVCKFKDYHLERKYTIIRKQKENIFNELRVYIKDDEFKMSREKANEEFLSIEIFDKYIKPWNTFQVGKTMDSLIPLIKSEEYHSDYGLVVVYAKEFTMDFFHKNSIINQINIRRNCKN